MDVRPIDANALPYVPAIVGDEGGWTEEIIAIPKSAVDDAPTLDYAPVRHGLIIESNANGKSKRVFSCCGTDCTKMTMWMMPIYCPYCGAKMGGKEAK